MKKRPASHSAFFNPRVLIGLAFCLITLVLALLAFALYPGGNAIAGSKQQQDAAGAPPYGSLIDGPPSDPIISIAPAVPEMMIDRAAGDQSCSTAFSENFDSVVAPALPAGWTAVNALGVAPLWVTSPTTPDTAPNDAFIDDPATVSDKYLETPLIPITTSPALLTFRNFYNLEPGFDGGVLEVSSPNINAGSFTDVTAVAVGGSFVGGGYNATISTAFMSPIGGRMAWAGNSGTYITTLANLGPNVIGQTIRLRFRMASDNSVSAAGWRVDTISVTVGCGVPTPTPAPTPTPTPTPDGSGCAWANQTVVPTPILDNPVVTVGSNMYSFGGVQNGVIAATSYRYDGATWTTIAPLPTAVEFPAAVTDGTNIFILGGALTGTGTPQTTLYRYNVGANNYTTLAPFATGTWNHAAVYLSGKIYKFAGTGPATASTNVMEIYDIGTNTWSVGATYPLSISFVSAFVQGNFIYAAGGIESVGSLSSSKTYRYDPGTNTWDDAAIADLPATRWGAASAFFNGGGVLAGGYVAGAATANISTSTISWNLAGNTWSNLPNMFGERARMTGAILNGCFHVVGGRSIASPNFVGTNDNQRMCCGPTPTPGPTGTPTPTPTASPTPTATPTPIACSSGTVGENFDAAVVPALPSGWSANNAVGAAPLWVTSNAGLPAPPADSVPNAAFIDDPAVVTDKRLDSVPYTIANPGTKLTFRNNFDLEDGTLPLGFDGGVLEISVNGGAFADIITAGGSFDTGGYNAVISTAFSSPISGRSAWSGASAGFITTVVNLPAAATGQTAVFRWRMATDSSVTGAGWRIDNVSMNCAGGPTPTPGGTATPTPTPTGTPGPTATPTPTPTIPPTVCDLPETFTDILTLPASGWVQKNNSSPIGIIGWFQGNTAVFQPHSPTGYIATNFQNGAGLATLSNWLVTAPITLQTGGQLTFWTRTVDAPAFPDRLQVRMSTNGTSSNVGTLATDVGDFTTLLLDINPTYTLAGYPTVWTSFTVNLPPMTTTKGRIAFRYFVENGGPSGANSDYIGIDTVFYSCTAGPTPTPVPTATPTPTPVPTGTPCPSPITVLSQDFESGLGSWTVANTTSGSACPLEADWTARPNPYDPSSAGCGGSAAQTPLNSGSGTQFAMANSDAAGSGSSVSTTLTSTAMNTVGMSSLSLSFKHFYRHLGSSVGAVEVSTAGAGGPWTLAKSYTATQGAAAAFVTDTVDLSAFVGNADTRVRFRYTSAWDWWWAIDDVVISTCGGATPTPPPTLSITGTVIYCTNPALPAISGVTMSLTGAPPAPTSVLTNVSGVYTLSGLSSGGSYTVTPTKAAKPPGTSGINTSDSIAIQRHFLVLGTPLTGCRLLAADTNDPANGVTTTDAIAAQRFFLGLTTGIAQTGRYKFSPVTRSYAPLLANQSAQDFNAIILGDAATAFVAPRPGGPEPDAAIENEIASSVAYVSIDRAGVSSSAIDAKSNLVGFQGDFTFDERVITFADNPVSNAGLTAGNWNVSANVLDGPGPIRTLRVSAFSLDGAPLSGTGVLFNLNTTNVDRAAEGALTWASGGEPFVFIDANLNTQRPGHGAPSQR